MINMRNNAKVPDVLHEREILIYLIFLFKPYLPKSLQRYLKFEDLKMGVLAGLRGIQEENTRI